MLIYEGGAVKSLAGFAQNVTVNKLKSVVPNELCFRIREPIFVDAELGVLRYGP